MGKGTVFKFAVGELLFPIPNSLFPNIIIHTKLNVKP